MPQVEKKVYDVVILGSGMGGLACANILSQEGLKVLVLEKNRQTGGNLQVFSRDRAIFDTGVHYLGGLAKGEPLYQLFKYFGIYDELKLIPLDAAGFDKIYFGDQTNGFEFANGYPGFASQLMHQFPEEKKSIAQYCEAIQKVIEAFPLATLKYADPQMVPQIPLDLSAKNFIESITQNELLRKVLAGNVSLYAGNENTPFYVHALVLHYYIISAWRCIDGGSQIAKEMVKKIRSHAGEVQIRKEIKHAIFNEFNELIGVATSDHEEFYGKYFISNIHPQHTLDIIGRNRFPQRYVSRIDQWPNYGGMFVMHIALEKNKVKYRNHNIFHIFNEDPWNHAYTTENWPPYYMISFGANAKNTAFTDSISVITCMNYEEVAEWENSYNHVTKPGKRPSNYDAFKENKCAVLLKKIQMHLPEIAPHILSITASTPLTQRDYTHSVKGSGYGLVKDVERPFLSLLNTKTPISNLFLTGQNITLHGILGVCMTALSTCFHFTSAEKLLEKIRNAE